MHITILLFDIFIAATAAQMMVLACLLRPISFYERIANASRIDKSKHIEDQSTEETIDPSLPIKDTSSQVILLTASPLIVTCPTTLLGDAYVRIFDDMVHHWFNKQCI